jgi:hypothetical protein
MSTVPSTVAQISVASGTASARRPKPLRARRTRPSERVPSGKTPMHAPAASSSTARPMARTSPDPRSIGIWPMPSRIFDRPGTFHIDALASAQIWRRGRPAMPMATGSQ